MRRYELTDEQWELIKDLFPLLVTNGRPWRDHRTMVNAMLWILNTGSPWRDLPDRYGPWQTAYNRFNRWRKDGTFDRILQRLQIRLDEEGRIDWDLWMVDGSSVRAHAAAAGAGKKGAPDEPGDHALGRSRGGFGTKIHVVSDGQGTPLAVHVTAGQVHETKGFQPVVDAVRIPPPLGRPRMRPSRLAGDKAYDVPWIRRWLRSHHITAVIPEKRKPHGRKPGAAGGPCSTGLRRRATDQSATMRGENPLTSAVRMDRDAHRRHNVIKRSIGRLKQARRIATRFANRAVHFPPIRKLTGTFPSSANGTDLSRRERQCARRHSCAKAASPPRAAAIHRKIGCTGLHFKRHRVYATRRSVRVLFRNTHIHGKAVLDRLLLVPWHLTLYRFVCLCDTHPVARACPFG